MKRPVNKTNQFFRVEARVSKAALKRQLRKQGITLIELINTYDWYDMKYMKRVYEYSIYETTIAMPIKILSSKEIVKMLRNCLNFRKR